jgi:DNA invertase Pin-like site-specific DNA recombinase
LRYGIVWRGVGLPPATLQQMAFEHEACDVILDEHPGVEQRALDKLLLRLRPEDELLVYTLEAFQRSTGEITRLFRQLMRAGVVLRLVQENQKFAR